MKFIKYFWIAVILFAFACKQPSDKIIVSSDDKIEFVEQIDNVVDTIRNTIDWEGTYEGTVWCSDCDKSDFLITLYPDNTYEMTTIQDGMEDIEQGSFDWNIQENKIRLNNPQNTEFVIEKQKIMFLNKDVELQKLK